MSTIAVKKPTTIPKLRNGCVVTNALVETKNLVNALLVYFGASFGEGTATLPRVSRIEARDGLICSPELVKSQ